MSGSRLIAIDVSRPLIAEVVARVRGLLNAGHDTVRVVFPNRRAVRFFLHQLGTDETLRVRPTSMEELVDELVFADDDPPVRLSDMDRWFLLMDLLRHDFQDLYKRLGGEPDRVFPWCGRLMRLLDELDMQQIERVQPLLYVEDVVPEAARLLEELDRVATAWRERMGEENCTGGGDRYRRAVARADTITEPVVAAGFAALTGSEQAILETLFRNDRLTLLFQTDLKNRHQPFEPYGIYADWMSGKRWGRKPDETVAGGTGWRRPTLRFLEAFDTHSQAGLLQTELAKGGDELEASPTEAAVVVPDSRSLLPVLQVIPQKKLNVTAGYPFRRTGFYRLLVQCMDLGAGMLPDRGAPLDKVVSLLNHPLVRPLLANGAEASEPAAWYQATAAIRSSRRTWMTPLELAAVMREEGVGHVAELLDKLIWPFGTVRSIEGMAGLLENLAEQIQSAVQDDGEFRLEMELLARFMETVQHAFLQSRYRNRKFPSNRVLFELVRHLADDITVRFEGNPLEGLQVMGFLETRMLQFSRLFVVDVIEGVLPQEPDPDPLLPVSLRPLVGLPGEREREAVETYHFFRLLDGASEATLLYRRGETSENRSVRSRFIEQLLVEEELQSSNGDGPVRVADWERDRIGRAVIRLPDVKDRPAVPRLTGDGLKRIQAYLQQGVSPSFFDEWVRCPYQVYLKRVLGLPELAGSPEDQDPREVGTLIHGVLEDVFRPLAEQESRLTAGLLRKLKNQALDLARTRLPQALPGLAPVRMDLLGQLVTIRLEAFFQSEQAEADKSPVHILAVEKDLKAPCGGITVRGKADRVDRVIDPDGSEIIRITDYKTGSSAKVPKPSAKWRKLIGQLSEMEPVSDLALLRANLNSIQLPLYAWMVADAFNVPFEQVQARLWLLGSNQAVAFDGKSMGADILEELVNWLASHLVANAELPAVDDTDCKWCRYYRVCPFTTHQEPRHVT